MTDSKYVRFKYDSKYDIFDVFRYGRRPTLFAMMAMQTVTIIIQMFSPSWEIFTAIYFFVGFSGFSNYVVAYVLGKSSLTRFQMSSVSPLVWLNSFLSINRLWNSQSSESGGVRFSGYLHGIWNWSDVSSFSSSFHPQLAMAGTHKRPHRTPLCSTVVVSSYFEEKDKSRPLG